MSEETREFDGKTLDDAIQNACKFFNCDKKDIDYEIITRGSTGIFGLGGKKARIKAICKKVQTEQTESDQLQIEVETKVEKQTSPKEDKTSPTRQEPQAKTQIKTQPTPYEELQYDAQSEHEGEDEDEDEETGHEDDASDTGQIEAGTSTPRKIIDKELAIKSAKEIAEQLLQMATINCSVSEAPDSSELKLVITGDDTSLVIGREGQTLDALEYITGRLVAKKFAPDAVPTVFIDVNDYRVKKEEKLAEIALKKAEIAKKTGKAIYLSPMTPKERRVIHMTLKNFPGIRTASIGVGDKRKVMLIPANADRNSGHAKGQGYKPKNPRWRSGQDNPNRTNKTEGNAPENNT